MPIRMLSLLGLAIVSQAGCQSFFPYGYGSAGAYPPMDAGTYPSNGVTGYPSRRGMPPSTFQPGNASTGAPGKKLTEVSPLPNKNSSEKDSSLVPKYNDPGSSPATLGRPGADDEDESIRLPAGKGNKSGVALKSLVDESEDTAAELGDDGFVKPTAYQSPSASIDSERTLRKESSLKPNPYGFDPNHKWLKGIVKHDAESNSWGITYSRDPLNDELHRGRLTLVDDELTENLIDNEVIYVEGRVDNSIPDQYGKPSYRLKELKHLRPKVN